MHFFYLWMYQIHFKKGCENTWPFCIGFFDAKSSYLEGLLGVHNLQTWDPPIFLHPDPPKKTETMTPITNSTLSCNYLLFLWRSMLQTWTVIPYHHLSHSSLNELLLLMVQKSCTSWYGTNSKKKIQVLYIPGGERQISEPSTVSLPCLNLKSGRFPISKSFAMNPCLPFLLNFSKICCKTCPQKMRTPQSGSWFFWREHVPRSFQPFTYK